MNKGLHIAFEGPSSAGKTNCSKLLTEKMSELDILTVYMKSSPSLKPLGKFIVESRNIDIPPIINDYLYFVDILSDFIDIKNYISEGISVVQDKTLLSLKSYCDLYRTENEKKTVLPILEYIEDIEPKPDMLIYLNISYEERKKRMIKSKDILDFDYKLLSDIYTDLKICSKFNEYVKTYDNVILIDNSEVSVEDTIDTILNEIKNKYGDRFGR